MGQTVTGQATNFVGNNLKSMHVSLEGSLKKLHTDYIDIFYVHWWDFVTPIEEIMNGLHNLVTQGKVLYLVRSPLPSSMKRPNASVYRVFRIPLPGLSLERTPTQEITAKLLS